MRNYIILNNKSSNDINGLIIQELAPISKPQQRTQVETIDGRDGDIVTPLGYAAYNKKIKIGLYGDFDINEIIAYFATQGTAIFSNEPDKYYNYQILDQIDYERLVRFRVATVTMHVQPFKYSATEGTLTIDASDTVSGEGSEIALDNTAEAPFTTLRHKGNATQKTYSGINIFETSDSMWTGQSAGRVTYSATNDDFTFHRPAGADYLVANGTLALKPSTTYSIMFDVAQNTMTDAFRIVLSSSCIKSSTLSIAAGTTGKFYGKLVTMPSLTQTYDMWFYCNSTGTLKAKIMLVEGDYTAQTFPNYEPYTNGASPNPYYPQDIKLLTGDSTIAIDDGGDNSQEYVIPFGDTYLAAIGDYADEPVKVGDTWYIRRAIGKVVLDGSSDENWGGINNNACFYSNLSDIYMPPISNIASIMSDYFVATSYNNLYASAVDYGIGAHNSTNRVLIRNKDCADATAFKTWLSTHPTTVYYALAEPTDEEITDQDLIDALDEFYGQAHSYKGHTHIAATAEDGNAPAILSVEVGEDNESIVANAGNTTSRPILTIYGQGDIGVYINDVEVLDIELGDEGYITLDSVEMEAYKDNTANLKNRLVTGDYSKLALNAGANKIRFTGTVTKYEISKYSRWL